MSSESLVLELQADALNSAISTPDLVRKALVVARKLDLPDLQAWCEAELQGYGPGMEVPPYRMMHGQLMAHNPFRGWIPVVFEDPAESELLSTRDLGASIGDINSLFKGERQDPTLQMPLPAHLVERFFGDTEEYRLGMIPTLIVSRNNVEGVLEAVRNTVLEWALKLEKEGILGESMSFSNDERAKAASITYNISSFQGVIGDVAGGTVQIGNLNTLSQQLKDVGVPAGERAEIEGVLRELERAPDDEKGPLIERGKAWLNRNAETIGSMAKVIAGALQA